MKSVLISDFEILKTDSWIKSHEFDFNELLLHIARIECDCIIIYAETLIKNGCRTDFSGIEILKHIRLTACLNNVNTKPILLLHWMPTDYYIDNNIENIILFSPGIYRKRLPIDKENINLSEFKGLEEGFNLRDFIFSSEKDEEISEHVFRNKIAIDEFKQQINSNSSVIAKPLWFKKLYYKEGYFFNKLNIEEEKYLLQIKILLIDDMADDWALAIKSVVPHAEIDTITSLTNGIEKIKNLKTQESLSINDLNAAINEINDLENDKTNTIFRIKNLKTEIQNKERDASVSSQNKSNTKENLLILQNDFNNFLKDFSVSKVMEDILDAEINEDNLKTNLPQVKSFVGTFTEILKSITSLNNYNNSYASLQVRISETREQLTKSENELKSISQRINNALSQKSTLINKIVNKPYDIILLDIHLSSESETKAINETDGYKILKEIKGSNLSIPVSFFSASKRDTSSLNNEFLKFPLSERFIKGITPISTFIKNLEQINNNSHITRLINLLDWVIEVPIYRKRVYENYSSPNYKLVDMTKDERKKAREDFLKIKKQLNTFSVTPEKFILTAIYKDLAEIVNSKILLVLNNVDTKNKNVDSLFKNENLIKNKISNKYVIMNNYRNKIRYGCNNINEEKDYDRFIKELNINIIKTSIADTINLLIFNT